MAALPPRQLYATEQEARYVLGHSSPPVVEQSRDSPVVLATEQAARYVNVLNGKYYFRHRRMVGKVSQTRG